MLAMMAAVGAWAIGGCELVSKMAAPEKCGTKIRFK